MANTIILPFSELQAELNDEAMIDPNAIVEITENGRYNVVKYGYVDVDVPQPSGKITITENGTDIDVSQYASADVDVSGDFTTAQATITNTSSDFSCSVSIPLKLESGGESVSLGYLVVNANDTVTVDFIMCNGKAVIFPLRGTVTNMTGNISMVDNDAIATGDFSIVMESGIN